MALEIKILDYGDIELEASFLVLGRDCGRTRRVPTYGFLILGGQYPVLVDTGYRNNAIMEILGMRGLQFHENMIENQLARHGVKPGDIRFLCPPLPHRPLPATGRPLPLPPPVVTAPPRCSAPSVSGPPAPALPFPRTPGTTFSTASTHPRRAPPRAPALSGPVALLPGLLPRLRRARPTRPGRCPIHRRALRPGYAPHLRRARLIVAFPAPVVPTLPAPCPAPAPARAGPPAVSPRARAGGPPQLLHTQRRFSLLPRHTPRLRRCAGAPVVAALALALVPGPVRAVPAPPRLVPPPCHARHAAARTRPYAPLRALVAAHRHPSARSTAGFPFPRGALPLGGPPARGLSPCSPPCRRPCAAAGPGPACAAVLPAPPPAARSPLRPRRPPLSPGATRDLVRPSLPRRPARAAVLASPSRARACPRARCGRGHRPAPSGSPPRWSRAA